MGFNSFNDGFSSFCFFKYRSKFEILKTNKNPSCNIRGKPFFFSRKRILRSGLGVGFGQATNSYSILCYFLTGH